VLYLSTLETFRVEALYKSTTFTFINYCYITIRSDKAALVHTVSCSVTSNICYIHPPVIITGQ